MSKYNLKTCVLFSAASVLGACNTFNLSSESSTRAEEWQPQINMPSSVIVCRDKECAPAKLSMSREYIYNSLTHLLEQNAHEKALICQADPLTHVCTEDYVTLPITVGVTPAHLYINDVEITDVSVALNHKSIELLLNYGISYNGQTPNCKPVKSLVYVKNAQNIVLEDAGYKCKMTTIGNTTIKTLFAIDYIDLDYGFIGGYYSIGLSGPAYGGGSRYMMFKFKNDAYPLSPDLTLKGLELQQKAQEEMIKAQEEALKAQALKEEELKKKEENLKEKEATLSEKEKTLSSKKGKSQDNLSEDEEDLDEDEEALDEDGEALDEDEEDFDEDEEDLDEDEEDFDGSQKEASDNNASETQPAEQDVILDEQGNPVYVFNDSDVFEGVECYSTVLEPMPCHEQWPCYKEPAIGKVVCPEPKAQEFTIITENGEEIKRSKGVIEPKALKNVNSGKILNTKDIKPVKQERRNMSVYDTPVSTTVKGMEYNGVQVFPIYKKKK